MVAMARAVVCLFLWLSVCQVRSSHINVEMNKTIQNLLQHYKIRNVDRFDGKPVFSRKALAGKMEVKRLFMGGVLETYEKLIGEMLKQLPTPSPQTTGSNDGPASSVTAAADAGGDIRTGLEYILTKIRALQHRYREQEMLLKELQALRHIQMDKRVVQSKALWELPWLYEEASSLSDEMQRRRRRRRQTRRLKSQLSG
ncbi:interferon gamma-like [Morone saxatilis]|uniref:interferon gamma-like n=1 Tax=Morone saxatilis TaxID=34816 RepID=UPI0015E24FC6|nr:interferon gamma-like [Morone saxatilis]